MTDENPNLPDNEEEIGNSDQAEATIRNIDQVKAPLSNCPNQINTDAIRTSTVWQNDS